jgi:hypothetical protein
MQPPPRPGFATRRGIQHVRTDGSWLRLHCTACLECQPGRAGNSAVTMRLNHQTFNALLAVLRAHRRVSAR